MREKTWLSEFKVSLPLQLKIFIAPGRALRRPEEAF